MQQLLLKHQIVQDINELSVQADIAIMEDRIDDLVHLTALSRHMMRVVKANLTFSMLLNFVAIILAITAVRDPVTGALVHNCGSVFVIVNSSFLLTWTMKKPHLRQASAPVVTSEERLSAI